MRILLRGVAAVIIGLTLSAGCDRDDQIVTYSAPKDVPRAPTTQTSPMAMDPTVVSDTPPQGARVQWTMPPGWKQVPSEQAMRYATIQVSADHPNVVFTITPLPADASEITALKPNVNRWENQLGLPPSDDAAMEKVVKHIQVNGVPFDLVDLTGAAEQSPRMRMLVALATSGGQIWFFKLAGPVDVLKPQEKNFTDFVQSVRFDTASPGSPPTQPPVAGTPETAPPPTGVAADVGATWTAPSTWQPEPQKPMRLASFKTPGDAEIIITKFSGDLGGTLANVNRWRGQVGLPDLASETDAKSQAAIQVNTHDAAVYDMTGPDGAKRLRVAVVKVGDDQWFFKLLGPTAAVAAQQSTFDSFLQSVKFGGDSK